MVDLQTCKHVLHIVVIDYDFVLLLIGEEMDLWTYIENPIEGHELPSAEDTSVKCALES